MEITELKNDNLNFEVKVLLSKNEIDLKSEKELLDVAKNAKIDGFRVGKAPLNILKKRYGQSIRINIIEKEVGEVIKKVETDHKLRKMSEPKIDILTDNATNSDFEFTLKYELLPEIAMPNFSDVSIEKPVLVPSDEDVASELKKLADNKKKYNLKIVGEIQKDHQVLINATGYINGHEKFEGGEVKDYKLVIGSKAFVDNFEDQLKGHKIGDTVEVNVVFPEDYYIKDLASKPTKFVVEILDVMAAEDVAIDDQLATYYNATNLDELTDRVKQVLVERMKSEIRVYLRMQVFNTLEQLLDFDLPQRILEQELQGLKKQISEQKDKEGLFENKTEEEIDQYLNKIALRRVRIGLFLNEYAEINKLTISEADLQEVILERAEGNSYLENMLLNYYKSNPKELKALYGPALENKAVQHILDNKISTTVKTFSTKEMKDFLNSKEEEFELL